MCERQPGVRGRETWAFETRQPGSQAGRQTDRQRDKKNGQSDRQIDSQTDGQTGIMRESLTIISSSSQFSPKEHPKSLQDLATK